MCPASEDQPDHLDPKQRAHPATGDLPPEQRDVFHRLLSTAVARLDERDNPDARRAIYALARRTLAEQQHGASPGAVKPDISREGVALEEAILHLELELSGARVPGIGPPPSSASEPATVAVGPPAEADGGGWEELKRFAGATAITASEPSQIAAVEAMGREAPIVPPDPVGEPIPPTPRRRRAAGAPQVPPSRTPSALPETPAPRSEEQPAAGIRPNRHLRRATPIRLAAATAVVGAAIGILVVVQMEKSRSPKSPPGEAAAPQTLAAQPNTAPKPEQAAVPATPQVAGAPSPPAPQGPEGLIASGETWLRNRDFDRAIGDFSVAIRDDPKLVQAYVKRGEAFSGKGTADRAARGDAVAKAYFERAIADFNTALQLNPKLAVALYDRGDAWVKLGNSDRAIDDFNEAIRLDPMNALAYRYRAATYAYKGDNDRAITDFSRAIQFAGHDGRRMPASQLFLAYNSRSILYEVKGLNDRALSDLSKMIEIHIKDPQTIEDFKSEWGAAAATALLVSVYQRRAKAYEKKGLRAEAVADLTQAIELNPDRAVNAYIERATLKEALAQRDQAIADFRKALVINPNVKEAKEGLARLKASP